MKLRKIFEISHCSKNIPFFSIIFHFYMEHSSRFSALLTFLSCISINNMVLQGILTEKYEQQNCVLWDISIVCPLLSWHMFQAHSDCSFIHTFALSQWNLTSSFWIWGIFKLILTPLPYFTLKLFRSRKPCISAVLSVFNSYMVRTVWQSALSSNLFHLFAPTVPTLGSWFMPFMVYALK